MINQMGRWLHQSDLAEIGKDYKSRNGNNPVPALFYLRLRFRIKRCT
jgi:hypothetical protein